jgi:FkbM family methyltransferase
MLVENLYKLQQFLKKLQIYRRIPDWFWCEKIVGAGVSFHKLDYERDTSKILIKPFNFVISKNKHQYHFLLKEKNVRLAQELKQDFNLKFQTNEKQELIINLDGIISIIQCEQDLEIIKEIFIQGVYNFIYNQPLVVIDIGMNTGWASLYFARRDNVQAVYSYEPFKKTYEEALGNFSLNPGLSNKIHAFNYGLGAKEEKITVEYDYQVKASIGVEGIPENLKKNKSKSLQTEDIFLKSASEVFVPIFAQYPEVDFMAKIDCEGSEYDILESLDRANLLSRFKIIIMEWHEKGPDKLVEYLTKAGFAIFSRRPKSKTIGMIYGLRC